MAKMWPFVFCAFTIVGVNADDLADFSNNLATDIAPLLVLFGEAMTRQYLSESTSFLDYFIFAMAPIGILTAVVSTIRVCGHPSLRAFIGRSQEGEATIEAELCTSTSRDVCELFNRGGVTRVLGRPSILELVYVPENAETDSAGRHLSREYFDAQMSIGSGWKELKSSDFKAKDQKSASFAPNPNLSLNVGIRKRPEWMFYTIAVIGFVLQAGVLAVAGVGVWTLHWNVGEEGGSSSDYAPVMFIAGTVVMCVGMWSCATLIGQTTLESRFKRTNDGNTQNPPLRSRLFWLQPGPQVIGDQNFDPFAYCENENDLLQNWTSSKRVNNPDIVKRFEFYALFAILTTLVGYVMQFIGLRGLKAWVSLSQLGITIVMSVLRGLLRMQRLGKSDNKLGNLADLVAGHELDWMAFELALSSAKETPCWHITGQHEEALEDQAQSDRSENTSLFHKVSSDATGADPTVESRKNDPRPAVSDKRLQIRVRLAQLTGQASFEMLNDSEFQKWKYDYVNVRLKANLLSAVVCEAAAKLAAARMFKATVRKDVHLRIESANSIGAGSGSRRTTSVILKRPPLSSQAGWTIDKAKIEAILGLWMWTIIFDRRVKYENDSLQQISDAEKIPLARIVAAGFDDTEWNAKANIQGEMDLWLGSSAVEFLEGTLSHKDQTVPSLASLWCCTGNKKSTATWEDIEIPLDSNAGRHKTSHSSQIRKRFCGWNTVHRTLRSGSSPSADSAASGPSLQDNKRPNVRFQFAELTSTKTVLLDICTQELFTALMMSLASLLTLNMPTFGESEGIMQLESAAVKIWANAFVDYRLGSYTEALLCIVPALRTYLPGIQPEDMLSVLRKRADEYRRESQWERAETLLRWACQQFRASFDDPTKYHLFTEAFRATGELYRVSLTHRDNDERKTFGASGVAWMIETYHSDRSPANAKIHEILDCYESIFQRMHERPANQELGKGRFLQALRDCNRTEALYNISSLDVKNINEFQLKMALPLAARRDWEEVVRALLEIKADLDSRDTRSRTAVSYCAELGYHRLLKLLKSLGASLDLADTSNQSPLS